MFEEDEARHRRAPYAPVSSLREFLEKIRDVTPPARVDRKYLQRLNVASNNEWALLSALKFLGIVDQHGVPTHAYRRLISSDPNSFKQTLRHLVETAYRPLLESGGLRMNAEDLRNYFRVTSSPSQAKNAARFFREVVALARIEGERATVREVEQDPGGEAVTPAEIDGDDAPTEEPFRQPAALHQPPDGVAQPVEILLAKAHLLEKLPPARPEWSAEQYAAICDRFVEMLHSLDRSL